MRPSHQAAKRSSASVPVSTSMPDSDRPDLFAALGVPLAVV
ncbi:MAG TPA: hypothetical protein VEW93_08975 [Acidimicrobiales bacterium]|nr:hypothetical protein [Acidimicrobiales bacterium]